MLYFSNIYKQFNYIYFILGLQKTFCLHGRTEVVVTDVMTGKCKHKHKHSLVSEQQQKKTVNVLPNKNL